MKSKLNTDDIDAAITRWQSRLRRAVRAIEKLETRRKRMVKAASKITVRKPEPELTPAQWAQQNPVPPAKDIDLTMPDFLDRGRKAQQAVDEIIAEQAEHKRKKTAGRIAKMKAKKAGDTRRMPLTGKAALAAIRAG